MLETDPYQAESNTSRVPNDYSPITTMSEASEATPTLSAGSYYEERAIPGKGIGIFATKHIPAGARVLCEAPLFVMPEDADIVEVHKTISNLSDGEKSSFFSLARSIEPHVDDDWIDQLFAAYDGSL